DSIVVEVAGSNRPGKIARAPAGAATVDLDKARVGVVEDLVAHVHVRAPANHDRVCFVPVHLSGRNGRGVIAGAPPRAATMNLGKAGFGIVEDFVAHVYVRAPDHNDLIEAIPVDSPGREGRGVVSRAPA